MILYNFAMTINENRYFLKTYFSELDGIKTDASKALAKPPAEKVFTTGTTAIKLPKPCKDVLKSANIFDVIQNRRSFRRYSDKKLSMEELSYLLWASYGRSNFDDEKDPKRTVPSGGACYTIETYIIAMNVENLEAGIYHYSPSEHSILFIKSIESMHETIESFMLDSKQPFLPGFAEKSGVLFIWSTVPYRGEYKFNVLAHKKVLIDAGHVCQNLYLASQSIDAGACAIGIYDQDKIDRLLDLDGKDEFVIYLAAVGKK